MAKRKRETAVDWQGEAERLREVLIRIEAMAHAAEALLMDLRFGRTAAERATLRRLAVLVEANADLVRGALTELSVVGSLPTRESLGRIRG